MKKLYWRPQKISLGVLALILLTAVIGLAAVEVLPVKKPKPYYGEKITASKLAKYAFDAVKEERLRRNIVISEEFDPAVSGLIGVISSPVTTNPGHLPAKQVSVNPNFAAIMVHYLRSVDVKEGSVVAVGMSSSFPAINIATLAALETMKVKPIIISSVGSSQWGANISEFLWPDMENFLYEQRIFSNRSVAATLGGLDDRALGLSPEATKIMEESLVMNGIRYLRVKNYKDSLEQRMSVYREEAIGKKIKAYINIGGGTTSVGTNLGKHLFSPGINLKVPVGGVGIDSVMGRFAQEGIPVIHITSIEKIAKGYGFPLQPKGIPPVGEGKIFVSEEYNKWLAGAVLAMILLVTYVLVRLDWGFRLFPTTVGRMSKSKPEPMI